MNFGSLLKTVAQLIGSDSDEIDANLFRFVRDMTNHRLRLFWDAAQWPESIKYSETLVSGKTYLPPSGAEVIEVYDKDPRLDHAAKEIDYLEDYDEASQSVAISFLKEMGTVFVKMRVACPFLEGDAVTEGDGYRNGNFYRFNSEVSIPSRAVNYLIRGVYADYLRSNNQPEQAAAEELSAEGVMNIELERLYSRKGQIPKTKVVTYG